MPLAIGDFNGDGGVPDLAITSAGNPSSDVGMVIILLGNGDGICKTASVIPGTSYTFVAVADFNKDGVPDLAVVGSADYTLTIFPGNGDGTFRATPAISTNPAPGNVAVADFNGDGVPRHWLFRAT